MITRYKKRRLQRRTPVKVYRCLNRKGRIYSIQQNGLVICHCDELSLRDVIFVVNKSGQDKARKTGVRNVHAFIVGFLNMHKEDVTKAKSITAITYNPFINDTFVGVSDNNPVYKGKFLTIGSGGVLLYR